MEKHIVIALGDYYPVPSANGICIDQIVNSFIESGYEVDLVVNDTEGQSAIKNIGHRTIFFIKMPLVRRIIERTQKENIGTHKIALNFLLKLVTILRLPLVICAYPLSSILYCNRFVKKIQSVARENNVVAVIGVHKPYEAIYGAYLAAKRISIPYYAYFLDPLVGGYQSDILGKKKLEERTIRYERNLISYARSAIFMNSHKNDVLKRFPRTEQERLFFLGPPLLRKHQQKHIKKEKKTDKKIVIYAGSVYEDIRNPRYIIQAFRYVKSAKLIMYVPDPGTWLNEYLNPNVILHEGISHEEIVRIMDDADALLNIGNSNSLFIPSKIIEYLNMEKPIISTYRVDDDTCLPYIERYPAGLSIDERFEDIKSAARKIDSFLMETEVDISFEKITELFYINTPKAFTDIIISNVVKEKDLN